MSYVFKTLATLILLNFFAPSYAATPSYDPVTGRLNLPEVLINDHSYSNIVLALGPDGRYQLLSSTSPVPLTDADNGQSIELVQGQFLEIKLASNPTTGYSWTFNSQSIDLVELQGNSSFVLDSDCGGRVGCGGSETGKFKAVKQGTGTLRLEYRRPWETTAPPAQVFQLSITVR